MDRVKLFSALAILALVPAQAIMAQSSSYGAPSLSSSFSSFGNSNQNQNGGYQSSSSSSSSSFNSGVSGNDPALLAASIPGPKVFRHISLFIAPPEQEQSRTRVIRTQQGPPDKHVQVIFVKAPSSSNSQQTEVILPEQPEQKTLVYVLVKKPENNENNIKVRGPVPTKPPAPEVYFIKYKNENGGNNGGGQVGGGYSGGGSSSSFRQSGTYSNSYGAPQ